MPRFINTPTKIEAAGTPPKLIEEIVGRVNTGDEKVSVAMMRAPPGWAEPSQQPEFEEITVVLEGSLRVEFEGGARDVTSGQAIHAAAGEWIRYSTPGLDGARYLAICLPAFSPDTVHRQESADGEA